MYANPCDQGSPLTDDISGAPVACALRSEDGTLCPVTYECTAVPGSTQAVCCPHNEETTENYNNSEDRPQTSTVFYLLNAFAKTVFQCVNIYTILPKVWKELGKE